MLRLCWPHEVILGLCCFHDFTFIPKFCLKKFPPVACVARLKICLLLSSSQCPASFTFRAFSLPPVACEWHLYRSRRRQVAKLDLFHRRCARICYRKMLSPGNAKPIFAFWKSQFDPFSHHVGAKLAYLRAMLDLCEPHPGVKFGHFEVMLRPCGPTLSHVDF